MHPYQVSVQPDGSIRIGGASHEKPRSAYECWLDAGYEGDIHDFLDSLKATDGHVHQNPSIELAINGIQHSDAGLVLSIPAQIVIVDKNISVSPEVIETLKASVQQK